MATWHNMAGTVLDYLRVGLSGIRLKNSAGSLSVRNSADTADTAVTASKVNISGDAIDINSDAASAGADWKYVLKRPATGMTAVVDLTLPPNAGTAGQILQTDGAGVLTWTAQASGSAVKSKTIATADTMTVAAGFELAYSDDLFLDGSVDVSGQLHVI